MSTLERDEIGSLGEGSSERIAIASIPSIDHLPMDSRDSGGISGGDGRSWRGV
jgi:hypothetical protein